MSIELLASSAGKDSSSPGMRARSIGRAPTLSTGFSGRSRKTLPFFSPATRTRKMLSRWLEFERNTFVLGWLAEEVTGRPYSEIVSEKFWQKMGAESDGLILVSEVGASGSHGNMSSTLRDLGRYGMLYTPSWKLVAKERVVPEALIKRIQKDGRHALYASGKSQAVWDSYMGEECLWGTRQFDFVTKDGDFGKAGYQGQTLYISPSKNLVVASFATCEKYDTYTFARAIRKAIK